MSAHAVQAPGGVGVWGSRTALRAALGGLLGAGLLAAQLGAAAPAAPATDCTVAGTARADLLVGTPGPDVICAGDGNDTLVGLGGDDILRGDAGNDTLRGLVGNDELDGGAGNDVLAGGEGQDRLHGGDGVDELAGWTGSDLLDGGEGNDWVIGEAGNDQLLGGLGNDRLDAGAGADLVAGAAGNDHVSGGTGSDRVEGGIGNDRMWGGPGDDHLAGEEGYDACDGETDVNTYSACEKQVDDPAADPDLGDVDGDLLLGTEEERFGSDPDVADTDGDGLRDGQELLTVTDPGARDTDGDGVEDLVDDSDEDGLANNTELARRTLPYSPDSDEDRRTDLAEEQDGTDPLRRDTDGDGLTDGDEHDLASGPLAVDTDGDGVSDGQDTFDRQVILPGTGVSLRATGVGAAVLDVALGEATDTELVEMPGLRAPPVLVQATTPLVSGTLTIPFDPSTVTDSTRLRVVHFDEDTGTFDAPVDQHIDLAAGTATVTTSDFSPFALVDEDELERVFAGRIPEPREGSGPADKVDVVLTIDSSGSMRTNDPDGERKRAGKALLDVLQDEDRAGVVDFDDDARVLQALTQDKAAVKAAIDLIDSQGTTNIGAGLRKALNQLDQYAESGRRRIVVLLTDGKGDYDPALTDRAIRSRTIVYTVALGGNADETLLRSIASRTGGRFYQVEHADQLVQAFLRIGVDLGEPDSDGDGLANTAETAGMRSGTGRVYVTQPRDADSDDDGLPDGLEMGALRSGGMWGLGTYFDVYSDPSRPDSDGDGLDDAQELETGTKPRLRDSDGDDLADLTELGAEFDPLNLNPDGDFLFDDEEYAKGSDPFMYDIQGKAASAHAAFAGFVFGDSWQSTGARALGVNEQIASSTWYLIGTLASGIAVFGDIREFVVGVGTGAWGTAAMSAIGVVPGLGDAIKSAAKVVSFARKSTQAVRAAVAVVRAKLPEKAAGPIIRTIAGLAKATLRQDALARGRTAPEPNFSIRTGTWAGAPKRISRDPEQAAALDRLLADLVRRDRSGERVTDVRVNQWQVAEGLEVRGINRPDLQYTLNGKRHYVEFDRPLCSDPTRSRRGAQHFQRILTNDNVDDPFDQIQLLLVGAGE